MAGHHDLATVITEFVRDAETGRVRVGGDHRGEMYGRAELRELRGALAHIDSELGTLPLDEVHPHDVQRLIDELRSAGLPPARLGAIVDALRSLYAYAIGRGLVRSSPVVGLTASARAAEPASRREPTRSQRTETRTPTEVMLELGQYAVSLLVKTAVIAFVLMAVGLVLALL